MSIDALTAKEAHSLRGLKAPAWWRVQCGPLGYLPAEDSSTNTQPTDTCPPSRPRTANTALSPLVADVVVRRHLLNPKALVVVGKSQAIVHLPRVGTRWYQDGHQETCIERRFRLRQLWRSACAAIPTIRAR